MFDIFKKKKEPLQDWLNDQSSKKEIKTIIELAKNRETNDSGHVRAFNIKEYEMFCKANIPAFVLTKPIINNDKTMQSYDCEFLGDVKELTLTQKLAEIQKDVDYIKKDSNVSFGQLNFDYISLNALLNMVRPLMAKHGVILIPQPVKREIEQFKTSKGAIQYRAVVDYKMIWVDSTSQDRLSFDWISTAENDFTRVLNAAATSARRNFLLNFFNIMSPDNIIDADALNSGDNRHPNELKPYLRAFYQRIESGKNLEQIFKELEDKLAIDNMSLGKKNIDYLTTCYTRKQKEMKGQ